MASFGVTKSANDNENHVRCFRVKTKTFGIFSNFQLNFDLKNEFFLK